MKKIIILLLFSGIGAILSGCCFYTVSLSKKADGGIYCTAEQATQMLSFPTMNYLISGSRYYYATAGRIPGKTGRTGAVAVLKKSTGMNILQCVSAEGITPCHLTLSPDENFLYTANYSSGDVSEFRLVNGRIAGSPRRIRHTGKGITKRQLSPHPHFVGFSPEGKQLFVSDLGTDEIFIYDYHPGKGIQLPCAEKLKLPPGSGPRHLVFSPCGKYLYTANELNSTASGFVKNNGKWLLFKTVSTLSQNVSTRNSPGAIKITADGKFFFISNRGHNSIAFFETRANGDFQLLDAVPSPGNFPSDILLIDNEKRLAVSHLKSGTVHFFKLDKKNKKLIAEQHSLTVPQAIALCR